MRRRQPPAVGFNSIMGGRTLGPLMNGDPFRVAHIMQSISAELFLWIGARLAIGPNDSDQSEV